MSDALLNFHEKVLGEIDIPKWMNLKCPFCGKEMPLRSIRSVSMRFNTRNMGDVTVEVFCVYCRRMDTLYFRKAAKDVADFISLLNGTKEPQSEPIIEETMYKQCYNNVMDKMMSRSPNEYDQKG